MAGDVLEEVARREGIVVVLDVMLWGWELGIQNVDPFAACGEGWWNVVGSWNACCVGCRQ